MFGLFNINKPAGMTSRRVVDRVQRRLGQVKAGHAGTLDPLATGVLVVCVGPATRLIEYVQQMPKQYRATFLLGRSSTTEDVEGEVAMLTDPPVPDRQQIEDGAARLTGAISQRPPVYSALKVGGQRAYRLARKGHQFQLQPRVVTIHRLDVLEYEYPELTVQVVCSSGTYVRSLGRDLAESLNTAAVMSALERTAVGHFHLRDACSPDELTEQNLSDHLIAAREAVRRLPEIRLGAAETAEIVQGRPVALPDLPGASGETFAGLAPDGRLLAILARRGRNKLHPLRVFATPQTD